MRFVHTCVRVRDIDASLRFYEALGFERRGRLQFDGAYNITSACRATATRLS